MRPRKRIFTYLKYILEPLIILRVENLEWDKSIDFVAEVIKSDYQGYKVGYISDGWARSLFRTLTPEELKQYAPAQ